jgi:hypothetical protein
MNPIRLSVCFAAPANLALRCLCQPNVALLQTILAFLCGLLELWFSLVPEISQKGSII